MMLWTRFILTINLEDHQQIARDATDQCNCLLCSHHNSGNINMTKILNIFTHMNEESQKFFFLLKSDFVENHQESTLLICEIDSTDSPVKFREFYSSADSVITSKFPSNNF